MPRLLTGMVRTRPQSPIPKYVFNLLLDFHLVFPERPAAIGILLFLERLRRAWESATHVYALGHRYSCGLKYMQYLYDDLRPKGCSRFPPS